MRLRALVVGTVCCSIVGMVAAAGPAVAATPWSVVSTPNPLGPPDARLAGVSCTSATRCVAVGDFTNPSGRHRPLAQAWDGSAWSRVAITYPTADSSLVAVQCTSAANCLAVGSAATPTGARTFAERWDGTTWSITPTPNPPNRTFVQLVGVSCTGATNCFAVGYSANGEFAFGETLILRWNGTVWSIAASPHPSTWQSSRLRSVSCTATGCFAVGFAYDGTTNAIIERWDGATWSVAASPHPAEWEFSDLSAVSCTSATHCLAVGGRAAPRLPEDEGLTEQWDGTAWSVVSDSFVIFTGLSCASPTSCFALNGSFFGRWNGTAWSQVESESTSQQSHDLAVSCVDPTFCAAVGERLYSSSSSSTLHRTLVHQWNGSAFVVVASPNPPSPPAAELKAVACPTVAQCFAVGRFAAGANGADRSLIEIGDGTTWSIATTPHPQGARSASLSDVACTTPTNCFAVGQVEYSSPFHIRGLIQRWNGTSWSIVARPVPLGSSDAELSGVTCLSATNCFAVGSGGPGTTTFTTRWNGSTWSVVPSPNRVGTGPGGDDENTLADVSCVSATFCIAVGQATLDFTRASTLVERWNGTNWSIVPSPTPSGVYAVALDGVSCTSTTNCFAVGQFRTGQFGPVFTLILRWNGSSWSRVSAPVPPNGVYDELFDVSCTSTTRCVAVGDYVDNTTQQHAPLAEQWDGTAWSLAAAPLPADDTNAWLEGVSCRGSTTCTAAGRSSRPPFGSRSLIERTS